MNSRTWGHGFTVFRCNMRMSPPCHRTPNIGCCFSCLHVQSEVVVFMSVAHIGLTMLLNLVE